MSKKLEVPGNAPSPDITERKQAEELIQQQNKFLTDIFESLPHPFYVVDANDYTIKMANRAAKLGDLSKASTCYALTHKRDKPCAGVDYVCPLEEVKKTRKPVVVEHIHYDKDGNPRNIEVHGYPIIDIKGSVIQMIEYSLDITERKRAEEVLLESEERFRDLFENANDLIQSVTPDGHFLYVNRMWQKVLGYSEEEVANLTLWDIIHPDFISHCRGIFQKIISGEAVNDIETVFVAKDGKLVTVEGNANCRFEGGEPVATRGIFRDITERKRMEEALQESEERYRALVNLGVEVGEAVIMLQDTGQGDGIQTFVSDEWPHITGYSRRELLGMSFFDLVHPKHRETSLERHYRKMRGEAMPGLFELSIVRKDGTEVPIELTSAYTTYQGKRANVAYIRDISERKRMEHTLNERVKELQCLYGIAYIAERPGITLDELCQEVVNLLPAGWQYPEVTCARITLDDKEFRTDNFRTTEWKQSANIKVKGQKEGTVEVYYLEERPRLDEGPFLKEERLLIDVVAERLGRITEREQAEEALEDSEERLRILFEFAPDAYYLNDLKGNFIDGNKIAEEITGYKRDELIGKSFLKLKLLSVKQIPKAATLLARNALGKATGPDEFILNRKGGNKVPVEIRTFPVKIKGKTLALGIARDITERKRAEEEMRVKDNAIASSINAIAIAGLEGNITYVNPSFLKMWGYDDEKEVLGKGAVEFWQVAEEAVKVMQVAMDRGGWVGELTARRKDGSIFYVQLSSIVVRDEAGKPICRFGSFVDITERKRMERELQERNEQLDAQNEELQSQTEELITQQQELIEKTGEVERANRLKSEFLANMSHELRTPLNVVIGFSELMRDEVPGKINDEQRQCLDDIQSSGKHLLNLINKVLDLSKVESGRTKLNLTNLALTEVIESLARTMLPILAPRQHSLDVEIEEGLPLVYADKTKVKEVLLNLLSNAAKFTPDGGKLKIEAVREDNWCQVSVIDNGIGIKREDQERIFEPFCQLDNPLTKEGSGTGLGLALVKQIIEKHGGQIRVESEYEKGSRFTFTLPLAITD